MTVREEGLRLTLSAPVGLTFGLGRIGDSNGDESFYLDFGVAVGFDGSIGYEGTVHNNIGLEKFDIYEAGGYGFMNNVGVSPLGAIGYDFGWGGDVNTLSFDRNLHPRGRNYKSKTHGVSLGVLPLPVSFTQTASHTWVW